VQIFPVAVGREAQSMYVMSMDKPLQLTIKMLKFLAKLLPMDTWKQHEKKQHQSIQSRLFVPMYVQLRMNHAISTKFSKTLSRSQTG